MVAQKKQRQTEYNETYTQISKKASFNYSI